MYEGYEMSDRHRGLLAKHRMYLLHNIHPTEILWSALMSNEVLSPDMVDEIKSCTTTTEKLGLLLDLLPSRGPEAFDQFIESLLECDHSHVAEYLKNIETTEKFRSEIDPHCSHMSENLTEKFVRIFRRNTPAVQRFAERKFELILEEQVQDLEKKEDELKTTENKNTMLQLELSQLRSLFRSCYETSENITSELKADYISKTFLREESKHIENLKTSIKDLSGFENIYKFFENTQHLLKFLEKYTEVKLRFKENEAKEKAEVVSSKGRSLQDKIHVLTNLIMQVGEDLGQKVNVPGIRVRVELEKIHQRVKDVTSDVMNVRDIFGNNVRQKRKLEGEVLAMLHYFQETRRLDAECREKQSHVNELNREAQMVKKKIIANSRQSRRMMEQIQKNLEKKKSQLKEVETDLYSNISSADQRLQALVNLLPDLEDATSNEFLRSDTEMTSEISSNPGSRIGTPMTHTNNQKGKSSLLEPHTYRKLVQAMGEKRNQDDDSDDELPSEDDKNNNNVNHDGKVHNSEGLHGKGIDIKQVQETVKSDSVAVVVQKSSSSLHPAPAKSPRKHSYLDPSRHSKQAVRMTSYVPNTVNFITDRSSAIHAHKEVKPHPETLSKTDIDRWLVEQQNNVQNLQRKVQRSSVSTNDVKEEKIPLKNMSHLKVTIGAVASSNSHEQRDNGTMEPIIESARSNVSVSRSVSMRESSSSLNHNDRGHVSSAQYKTSSTSHNVPEPHHEKGWYETKNNSASSGNNSSESVCTPDNNTKDDSQGAQNVLVKSSSRNPNRSQDPVTRSHDTTINSRTSREKFVSVSSEKMYLDRRKNSQHVSMSVNTQDCNAAMETMAELSTASRAARKSYSSMPKDKDAEQKARFGREALSTRRIDLFLPGS